MVDMCVFLGNGFDINLGIESIYANYCKDYLPKISFDANGGIIDANIRGFLDSFVKNDWSDLEIAIGENIVQLCNGNALLISHFCDVVSKSLKEYLTKEQNLLEVSNQFGDIMWVCIETIYDMFNDTQIPISKAKIFSFNYTNYYDTYLENMNLGALDVYHIHGALSDKNIILGVDSIEQIKNKEHVPQNFLDKNLIKPYINQIKRANVIEQINRDLSYINKIFIFGVSFGITDSTWWNKLNNWLNLSSDRELIIHIYRDSDTNFNLKKDYISGLFNHSTQVHFIDNDVFAKLRNNIKVNKRDIFYKLK